MPYPIRTLTIDDYYEMIALWLQCGFKKHPDGRDSRDDIARQIDHHGTRFWGMFDGDKMIGSIIADSNGRKGWINRLAVHPDYRGRGLAVQLIAKCERFFEGLGLSVFSALIERSNESSFGAFRKAGFSRAENITYWSKRPPVDS